MSLIDDRDVPPARAVEIASEERRRVAAGPRLSWASSQPFVRRGPGTRGEPGRGGRHGLEWREQQTTYQWSTVARDVLLCTVIPTVLLFVMHGFTLLQLGWGAAIGLVFVVMVGVERGYERANLGDGPLEFQAVLRGGVLTSATLALFAVGFDADVPRTVVFGALPLMMGALAVARHLNRRGLHRRRRDGEAMRRTLVVGDSAAIDRVVADLRAAPQHGYQIAGVCVPALAEPGPEVGVPVLGSLSDIPQVVVDGDFDVVIVAGSDLTGQALRRLSWALEQTGASLVVAPGLVEVFGPRVMLEPTAGLSLIHVRPAESRGPRVALKRLFDLGGAVVALVLLAPLLLAVAAVVRLTSPGPALFRQTRVGKEGSEFKMLKFRSMVVGAEAQQAGLHDHNQADGPLFKLDDDPRVTRVGRFLRKHSIDEFPQLINVLRGEMALVGPRPPLAHEVAQYGDAVGRRLLVKPGLTGLWQISGRADLPWKEAVKLDLRYVENWSIALDLMILWKTVNVVVSGRGGR
ncbi:sugar transferase [Cellulomonas chengniuliangii]|uniref:Sugar transferase n=1 Tax=Cellulomonas chengniuliangii TaxID=2968084 RepID=A0ABY5KZW9_9CELL|nr:sugar transferase [Cellulomonas chengniuliangii]MCC2307140.1 sugar transferase [Cellulomonas chengniuliangii]UUI76062.1 sugar transferase [Cellulomonas chengniuliangii]